MGPPADDVALWFLTADERGNPDTRIDADRGDGGDGVAWTEGNQVRAMVHGAEYFRCLLETWRALDRGDLVLLTDWRGDGDERLTASRGPSWRRCWSTSCGGASTCGASCGGRIPTRRTSASRRPSTSPRW